MMKKTNEYGGRELEKQRPKIFWKLMMWLGGILAYFLLFVFPPAFVIGLALWVYGGLKWINHSRR